MTNLGIPLSGRVHNSTLQNKSLPIYIVNRNRVDRTINIVESILQEEKPEGVYPTCSLNEWRPTTWCVNYGSHPVERLVSFRNGYTIVSECNSLTDEVWCFILIIFDQYNTYIGIGYTPKFNFKLEQENITTLASCIFRRCHTTVRRRFRWLSHGAVTL